MARLRGGQVDIFARPTPLGEVPSKGHAVLPVPSNARREFGHGDLFVGGTIEMASILPLLSSTFHQGALGTDATSTRLAYAARREGIRNACALTVGKV